LTVEDLITKRILIKDTDDNVLIDGDNKLIDFSKFTTILGNISMDNLTLTGAITWDASGLTGLVPPNAAQVGALSTNTFIPDEGYITTITNDTVKTTNVLASNLVVKSGNIQGTLTASQFEIKGKSVSDGSKTTFAIDNNGNVTIAGNISMTGGSISWGDITKPRGLTYDAVNDKLNLSADNITGGTLSGITLDVNTDATIGKHLYLSPTDYGGGIIWNGVGEIYIDPMGKSVMIEGTNAVSIGKSSTTTFLNGTIVFEKPVSGITAEAVFA
jgi:hypothetical protein